ncbi:hypothetical protein NLI96_g6844 [Meripilus lineatus]|uniref:F-box domain-containing protein n=1 Tax=Meripilus lineatus TaxID=2056292 RepID=A0AAD5V504_9APHY|nr:hypothetical protein NLI96_g6844 [Physisporinus lineatus]
MQASKLPIEVCERVIDNLAISVLNPTWIDYAVALQSMPTLYACSLVCCDWVPRSQHHLLRQVQLRTTRQADAFLDTLTHHPHRAQLVQYLEIRPRPPHSPPPSLEAISPSLIPSESGPPSPTSSDVSVLPQFPFDVPSPISSSSLHSLQLSVSVSNDRQTNLEETPPQSETGDPVPSSIPESGIPLRDQTQDKVEVIYIPPCYYNWIYKVLMRLPPLLVNLSILSLRDLPALHPRFIRLVPCFKTVKALALQDLASQSFGEIIQLVNRLPQLRGLYFNDLKWDQPARFFPSHRLRLEHLFSFFDSSRSKGMMTDILDWLGSLKDLSGLRSLRFPLLDNSHSSKLHHVLRRCTPSLRFLDLWSDNVDIFKSLSLSSHLELEFLDILIPSSHFPNDIPLFSSRISHLLSPSLVYLVINSFGMLESLAELPSSLKDLDDALTHPKFTRLAYLVIGLIGVRVRNIDRETLRATFRNALPKSYQRGILWVAKSIEVDGFLERRAYHICEDDDREFSMVQLESSYFRTSESG